VTAGKRFARAAGAVYLLVVVVAAIVQDACLSRAGKFLFVRCRRGKKPVRRADALDLLARPASSAASGR